jgi:alkylhydroperoxidase family enzyme
MNRHTNDGSDAAKVTGRAQVEGIYCAFAAEQLCKRIPLMQARMTAAPPIRETREESFLPPIEKPKNLMMKLVFYFTRRQYGKVLAPLTVFAARMPLAFGMFYGKVSSLDKKLQLPLETAVLIRVQVARLNVCLFCIDAARAFAITKSMNEVKFDALDQYQTSKLFNDAERAVLDYVTELTKEKRVNPTTFFRLSSYYDERQVCEIVWLVASEHIYNITNIGLNIHADLICDIVRRKARSTG